MPIYIKYLIDYYSQSQLSTFMYQIILSNHVIQIVIYYCYCCYYSVVSAIMVAIIYMFKIQKLQKQGATKASQQDSCIMSDIKFSGVRINMIQYDINDISAIMDSYFDKANLPNYTLTLTATKVIIVGVNDNKLMNRLNDIFINNHNHTERMYLLFAISSRYRIQIERLIGNLNTKAQFIFIKNIFIQYFLGHQIYQPDFIAEQLEGIFVLIQNQDRLSTIIENEFAHRNPELMSYLKRITNIITRNHKFNSFLSRIGQYGFNNKKSQSSKLLKQYGINSITTKLINIIIKRFPSIGGIITTSLIQSLSSQNIFQLDEVLSNTQLEGSLKVAKRQWINKDNNFWSIVQKLFHQIKYRLKIYQLSKQLNDPSQINQLISIKYLNLYFKGQTIPLQEQKLNNKLLRNDCQSELVKSINNCRGKDLFRVIIINQMYGPKHWKLCDATTNPPKELKKIISNLISLKEIIVQEAAKKGKKIQIAFNVIHIFDKLTNTNQLVTYQQLIDYINSKNINYQYSKQYTVQKEQSGKYLQSKKKQAIVIQAMLVKIVKHQKKPQNLQFLTNQLKIDQQQCLKCLLSLIRKGIVQKDQNDLYVYIP